MVIHVYFGSTTNDSSIMIITIVRHGKAGKAITDKARELTGRGVDDISFGSHQLLEICAEKSLPPPDFIWHSNWLRTTQTAEILAAAYNAPIKPLAALLPGSGIRDVDAALDKLSSQSDRIEHHVLVGHQPLVSTLVEHYLGDQGRVPFLPPGAMVCMQLDVAQKNCGELLFWAFAPEYRCYV